MKTPQELHKFLDEALDPNKVQLVCGEHGYKPGTLTGLPHQRCPKCWLVAFIYQIGRSSPEKRMEVFEKLERGIVDACAAEDRGKMDFVPSRNQQIEIAKS